MGGLDSVGHYYRTHAAALQPRRTVSARRRTRTNCTGNNGVRRGDNKTYLLPAARFRIAPGLPDLWVNGFHSHEKFLRRWRFPPPVQ